MHKKKIRFIAGAAVLAGLMGLWVFLKTGEGADPAPKAAAGTMQAAENNPNDSSEKEESAETIAKNFQKICVEYGDGRNTLEIQRDQEESCIVDLDENRVDSSVREEVVEELDGLCMVRNLGEQKDLEQYGLQTESVKNPGTQENASSDGNGIYVVLTQENGTNLEFQIGAAVAGRENSYYALQDGEVLILSSFPEELLEGRTAFYKKILISIPTQTDSEGYAADEFEYLEFSGKAGEDICIVPDEEAASGYLMTKPVRAEALLGETNADTGSVSMYDLLGLIRAEKVKSEECSGKALQEAGLADDTSCRVSYSMNGEAHEIRIGKEEKDGYDLMLDDDPALYLVPREWAEKVLNLSVMNLRASYIWLVQLSDLSSVTVACRKSEKTWQIQEDGSAVCEGKKVSKEEFLPKYQELIGMTVLNVEEPEQVKEEAVLTILYQYKNSEDQQNENDSHTVKVEIMPLETSDRYAAYLDGDFAGILRNDTVEAVLQSWA